MRRIILNLKLFISDERGVSAMVWTLTFPVMFLTVGLGLGATHLMYTKIELQTAADNAAAAVAQGAAPGGVGPEYIGDEAIDAGGEGGGQQQEDGEAERAQQHDTAMKSLEENGFTRGVTAVVNHPPLSGDYAGNGNAYEVIATSTQFSNAFVPDYSALNLTVRAVALREDPGKVCMLALSGTDPGGHYERLELSGNITMDAGDCVLASNDPDAGSVSISGLPGHATLNIHKIYAAGTYAAAAGSVTLNTGGSTAENADPLPDPYRSHGMPPYRIGACDAWSGEYSVTPSGIMKTYQGVSTWIGYVTQLNIPPGVHCDFRILDTFNIPNLAVTFLSGGQHLFRGGFSISDSAGRVGGGVVFQPGEYVVDGGHLTLHHLSQLSGSGVTFFMGDAGNVLARPTPYETAQAVSIDSRNVSLTAPSAGANAGILFYGDPNVNPGGVGRYSFHGNSAIAGGSTHLSGLIYFPKGVIDIAGSNPATLVCAPMVGGHVGVQGSAAVNIDMNCPAGYPALADMPASTAVTKFAE